MWPQRLTGTIKIDDYIATKIHETFACFGDILILHYQLQ